jgi:tetratricopeptide (TPR) repeat protein
MNQLILLLNTLLPSELNKLKKMRLIGTERKVFNYVFSFRLKETTHTNQICNDLEITLTHFYKICSVLTDKIYKVLIPERGFALLQFLLKKDLIGHFKHELLMQEKLICKDASEKSVLEKFYSKSYMYLLGFSSEYFDAYLLDSYGKKYIEFKENSSMGDQLFVRNAYISSVISDLKTTIKGQQSAYSAYQELLANEKILQNNPHTFAQFYLNKSLGIYSEKYLNDAQNAIHYYQLNIELIKQYPQLLSDNELVATDTKIAEIHYKTGHFESAIQVFERINQTYPFFFFNNSSAVIHFCELLIIFEKYDFAIRFIQSKFFNSTEGRNTNLSMNGSILLTKLFLLQGDFTKAYSAIITSKKLLSKIDTPFVEIEIKILENIYFILSKDFKASKILLKKNIKLLTGLNSILGESHFEKIIYLLEVMLKPDFKLKPLKKKYTQQIELLNHSKSKIYGLLLNNVLEVVTTNDIIN